MASEDSKMDAALGSEARYQPAQPSPFGTAFWDFCKVFWEAEARFDEVFRRDRGVAVWAANRVRTNYDLAK